MNKYGIKVNEEIINYSRVTNEKKRFAFNEDKTMIRASQGHSIEIDLALSPVEPPEFLFHGTRKEHRFYLTKWYSEMNRQYVHLSKEKQQ